MPVGASDYDDNAGTRGVSIESMALSTRNDGTFVSRVLDAGDDRVTGLTVAATGDAPTGSSLAYTARTAATQAGLDAADWVSLGAVPAKRYVQYRATMVSGDPTVTPSVAKVEAAFTVDDQAPVVTVDPAEVNGAAAKVQFRSDDPSAKLQCSLDGAAFAACTSPASFSGLANGEHAVAVRATDAVGNAAVATVKFTVDVKAPVQGGSDPAPSGNGPAAPAADVTAPKVLVRGTSLKVSRHGGAGLRIRCPRSEESCTVSVKVKLSGKTVARRTLTLSSGSTQTFRLKLSRSARTKLAAQSRLAATAVIAATDAAGNRITQSRAITLRAPSH